MVFTQSAAVSGPYQKIRSINVINISCWLIQKEYEHNLLRPPNSQPLIVFEDADGDVVGDAKGDCVA